MYFTEPCSLYSEVLECFRRHELLEWTLFETQYGQALRERLGECPATDVFALDTELGAVHWEHLRKRVIEHVSASVLCTLTHYMQYYFYLVV